MLFCLACDPLAKPHDGKQGESLSKEQETCSASSDCREPLRCVEGACQNPTTSRLGSYYWAAGRLLAKRRSFQDATVSFQQAVGQFEAEKLTVPPGLLCEYGSALRNLKADPKAIEQSPRILHRCLLGSLAGSASYWRALDELAELEEAGLDPALLARDTPGDSYLTRPAKAPSIDTLTVVVDKSTPSRSAGYESFAASLGSAEVSGLLTPCYSAYWAAAQKQTLTVELPVSFKANYDDFEDEYYGGSLELLPGTATGAQGEAETCVRDKLKTLAAEFGKKQNTAGWKGAYKLTLSAKM